nr:putative acyl-CoA N-acyltransferase [Raoultella sp. NCTC 9187]
MDEILNLTARMAQQGIRRLLVLSGDEAWCLQQALALRERLAGMVCGSLPSRCRRPLALPAP